MRESASLPPTSSRSAELLERIAQTLGVSVEVFCGSCESFSGLKTHVDVETMSADLVAAFRRIDDPGVQSSVLMLVKKLAGRNDVTGQSAILES